MTAATILKRINTQRKEIMRYEKEIKHYEKELHEDDCNERWSAECKRWIQYYQKHIERVEAKIAEMSKEAAKLATVEEESAMIKAMAEDMAKRGFKKIGFTTKGLKYFIDGNNGFTYRSRYCFSMSIEGKGTVFTSGTLETVAEYIIRN